MTHKKKLRFNDRLRYMKGVKVVGEQEFGYEVVHNHLPLNGLLGNKKAMYYMMKEYCKITDKKLFEIVPLTYHIKKGLMDEQFK